MKSKVLAIFGAVVGAGILVGMIIHGSRDNAFDIAWNGIIPAVAVGLFWESWRAWHGKLGFGGLWRKRDP